MTEYELKNRIKELRTELESRHKTGLVKIASSDGKPVPSDQLQNEMFNLLYKLSKVLTEKEEENLKTSFFV